MYVARVFPGGAQEGAVKEAVGLIVCIRLYIYYVVQQSGGFDRLRLTNNIN